MIEKKPNSININKPIEAMNVADLFTFVTSELIRIQEEKTGKPNGVPKLEVIPGELVKITIPEHLPRMAIYSKVVFINNKPFYQAYSAAKTRWYGLTRKALQGYDGKAIDPCLIYVVYFTPYICDFDNYSIKFIIDALKHHGCIEDDNFLHTQEGARKIKVDKQNPRTEIYVVRDDGWIDEQLNHFDNLLNKME